MTLGPFPCVCGIPLMDETFFQTPYYNLRNKNNYKKK